MLFAPIAEWYEHRDLGVTYNLPFSKWEKVFAYTMATAIEIDKVVLYSAILEFDMLSCRARTARNRPQEEFLIRSAKMVDVDQLARSKFPVINELGSVALSKAGTVILFDSSSQ